MIFTSFYSQLHQSIESNENGEVASVQSTLSSMWRSDIKITFYMKVLTLMLLPHIITTLKVCTGKERPSDVRWKKKRKSELQVRQEKENKNTSERCSNCVSVDEKIKVTLMTVTSVLVWLSSTKSNSTAA